MNHAAFERFGIEDMSVWQIKNYPVVLMLKGTAHDSTHETSFSLLFNSQDFYIYQRIYHVSSAE